MKYIIHSRWLSVMLALVMVIGMIPMSALPVSSAQPSTINNLEIYFRNSSRLPVVGDPIVRLQTEMETDDDRVTITGSSVYWCLDDSSVSINDTGKDTGMYFEAGRSYNATVVVGVKDMDAHRFSENATITLRNPGDFTYTAKIDKISDTGSGHFANIKLTITMNGSRTYPDISRVVFQDMKTPAAGEIPPSAKIYCNNCTLTDFNWIGDKWGKSQFGMNTFVEGESYQYKLTLTAAEGYRFNKNTVAIFTNDGSSKTPANYEYSSNYKVLTVTYNYSIEGITYLNHVEATLLYSYETLTPIAGKKAVNIGSSPYHPFLSDEEAPYGIVRNLFDPWYDEDGKELDYTNLFEAGKTYYFEIAYSIKAEYEHLYRFAEKDLTCEIIGDSYSGRGFVKAERVETDTHDNTYVKFRYYFTAQFADGVGLSANNPAVCASYSEFKFAMQSPGIQYVALGNVEDVLPIIPHNKEEDPYGNHIEATSIVVRGRKDLNLLGNAVFKCPMSRDYYGDCKYYTQLMTLTSVANSNLYIHGAGSLTYEGGGMYFFNSAILSPLGLLASEASRRLSLWRSAHPTLR